MKKYIFIALVALIVFYAGSFVLAFRQHHETLPLVSFSVQSANIKDVGIIKVSGQGAAHGITSLKISAFGKDVNVGKEHLDKLVGESLNGITLDYSDGGTPYKDTTVDKYVAINFPRKLRGRNFESKELIYSENGEILITTSIEPAEFRRK